MKFKLKKLGQSIAKSAAKAAKDAAVKKVRSSLQGSLIKNVNKLTKSRTPKVSSKDLTGVTVSGRRSSGPSGPQ